MLYNISDGATTYWSGLKCLLFIIGFNPIKLNFDTFTGLHIS